MEPIFQRSILSNLLPLLPDESVKVLQDVNRELSMQVALVLNDNLFYLRKLEHDYGLTIHLEVYKENREDLYKYVQVSGTQAMHLDAKCKYCRSCTI